MDPRTKEGLEIIKIGINYFYFILKLRFYNANEHPPDNAYINVTKITIFYSFLDISLKIISNIEDIIYFIIKI